MNSTDKVPHYIFAAMAALFIVAAIAGFAPTSLSLIAGVSSGRLPPPPLAVHFHAATMSLWLMLLLTQALLAHIGNLVLHRTLGLASLLLAPSVLLSMVGVELSSLKGSMAAAQAGSGSDSTEFMQGAAAALLIHGASYLFFPAFYGWALLARRKDNDTHKRMMILATLVLMIPGLGRLLSVSQVLPDFGLNLVDARHLWLLLLLAPALVYEIVVTRRIHRAYASGLILLGLWMVAAHFLWNASWWNETAPKLLGL